MRHWERLLATEAKLLCSISVCLSHIHKFAAYFVGCGNYIIADDIGNHRNVHAFAMHLNLYDYRTLQCFTFARIAVEFYIT